MHITITCRGPIQHTNDLDEHIKQKLQKVLHLLEKDQGPQAITVVLDGHPTHAHHEVHIHVSSPLHHRMVKREGKDIYAVLDDAIDIIYRDLCNDHKARTTRRKNAGPHRP